MMPGMSGAQFQKEQVVIVSADANARAVAQQLHAADCLVKPLKLNALVEAARRFANQ
jgi:response regulator of citrate/malate metabolism